MIETKDPIKPPPRQAMEKCPEPMAWGEFISRERFKALDGEGQVNALLEYGVVHVLGALGECNTRHDALVDYVEEIHR